MKQVKYIGRKPSRADNLAGTGVVWMGAGDVQPVSDEAWEVLKAHPTVWELVADEPAKPAPGLADASVHVDTKPAETPTIAPDGPATTDTVVVPAAADLSTMDVPALREWAAANGKRIDGRLKSADAIRAHLTAA